MARKNSLDVEIASNQSLSASFNSSPTIVQNVDNISYQINVTTSNSTGTFALQGSNDYSSVNVSGTANAGTWVNLPLGGGTPTVNATNDQIVIDINQFPMYAIRLAYTAGTAGTGTCNIFINARQIGG